MHFHNILTIKQGKPCYIGILYNPWSDPEKCQAGRTVVPPCFKILVQISIVVTNLSEKMIKNGFSHHFWECNARDITCEAHSFISKGEITPLAAQIYNPGQNECQIISRINLIIKHLDLNWLQAILVYNSSLSCPSENREDDPSSFSAPYCQCIYDATSFKNRLMHPTMCFYSQSGMKHGLSGIHICRVI